MLPVFVLVSLILLIALLLFRPIQTRTLVSKPHPVHTYAEVEQRINKLLAAEKPVLNPLCRLQFMSHGEKVERAVLFFHGFSNCPQQFHELGSLFFDRGYNVLIAPLPHHGLSDRMTTDQERFTAEELAAFTDEMVDLSHGLGDQVTLVGFSAGGVATAWAAQNRRDIDRAVIISPGFGYQLIPTPLTMPVANLALALPNFYRWWDPELKEAIGPKHAYPRYSTHALAQILRLSYAVRVEARSARPQTQSILVITNANEPAVNNELTAQVVEAWRKNGAVNLQTQEFEAGLQLDHDFIDPDQPNQPTEIVYPRLVEWITK